MIAYCNAPSSSSRPTLPPLHTLDLPIGKTQLPRIHELYDSYEFNRQTFSRLRTPTHHRQRPTRQVSTSSSSSSRTPSPAPSTSSNFSTFSSSTACTSPSPSPKSQHPTTKLRLVPTDLDSADAVVVVSPVSKTSSDGATASGQTALLLVGPALQELRHPQRPLARGSRIHPYRIVKGPSSRRPSSHPSAMEV